MSRPSTFTTPVFFRLLGLLARRGEPWSRVKKLGALVRPMTPDEVNRTCEQLALQLREPHLGIAVAQALAPGDLELLEFLSISGPSWLASMDRVVRHGALLNPALQIQLVTTAVTVEIVERVPAHSAAMGRHVNEFSLVAYLLLLSRAQGARVVPLSAALAHADDRSRPRLEALLGGGKLQFGAGENRLRYRRRDLERPLVTTNPALFEFLDGVANQQSAGQTGTSLTVLVERQVQLGLIERRVGIGEVARALHMSGRTLQRRLAGEGIVFGELVDALRRRLASRAIEDGLPLAEVSYLLGYAEPRSLRRALRRWKLGATRRDYAAR